MNQNKKATSSPAIKHTNVQQQAAEGTNVNIGSASDQGLNNDSPKRNTKFQAAEGSSAAQRNIISERIQLIKERYKNIRILLRIQPATKECEGVNQSTNESPNDDNNVLSGQYLEYIITAFDIFY